MSKRKIKEGISVTLPIRNEEVNIKLFAIPLYKYLKKNFENFELILVENGSTDNTLKILNSIAKKYKEMRILNLRYGNYGRAILHGLKNSKNRFLVYTDADGCIKPKEIKENIVRLKDYDVIFFYRVGKRESISRAVYSFFYNWLVRILFLKPIKDVNFSLKMFRKDFFDKLDLGYGKSMWFVDADMILITYKNKGKIMWAPAELIKRKAGASSVSKKVIFSLLRDVISYRLHTLFK